MKDSESGDLSLKPTLPECRDISQATTSSDPPEPEASTKSNCQQRQNLVQIIQIFGPQRKTSSALAGPPSGVVSGESREILTGRFTDLEGCTKQCVCDRCQSTALGTIVSRVSRTVPELFQKASDPRKSPSPRK